nr:hypothetical protein [Tanacetum cinerariifolium]
MLKRLAGHEYYCFLDGLSGYFQIYIALKDQDKTTFTFPYGTFTYKWIPFGLRNTPTTFKRCMTAIFYEIIEDSMEVENTNREIKRILKKTIRNNRKEWSYKLDDALWTFQIALETPLGTTSLRIIYGKACHLLVKLEHKAYWNIKNCNIDLTKAGANMFLQINELDEMRLDAYESFISYKERTKRWHNKRIKTPTKYGKGDKVLLFNSHLRLLPKKLKSRWYGLFSVSKDMKNSAIELYDEDGNEFIVNKQRVKPYQKDVLDADKDDDITLKDEGEVTYGRVTLSLAIRQ